MNPLQALTEAFGADLASVRTAEPGYAWYRCETCGEDQKRRKDKQQPRCILTPGCHGKVYLILEARCVVCDRPLTRRSTDGYCTAKCRKKGEA